METKTCKRGHERNVTIVGCAQCRKITSKAWYHTNIEEKRAYMRDHSKARYKIKKAEYKDKKRKNVYGITTAEYNLMLSNQNGTCAICLRVPDKSLCIDHCHVSGKVRGLLCNPCNKGLGLFKDNIDHLNRAIMYLGDSK